MLNQLKIENIVYYVADIDRTQTFYRDALGLEVERTPGDEEGDFLIAKTAGGLDLIFFEMQDMASGNSPVIVYTLEQGGIDDMVSALAEKGAAIVTPISHAPGGWSADLSDPDGHVFSVYQEESKPR